MSSTTNPKKSYHHGDLHAALLDEAIQMLLETGEESLSIRQLAARIGVSRTAPYHHFRDKQELLCAVAEEGFRRLRATAYEPVASDPSLSPFQQIDRFIDGYLDFALENREFYDLMFGSRLWKSAELTSTLLEGARGIFRDYLGFVENWQAQGVITPAVSTTQFAQLTWSTLHGLCRLMIDGIYVNTESAESIGDAAKLLFFNRQGK